MKQIIVVSDSHGNDEILRHIVSKHPNAIAYLHLGDSQDYESNLYPFITVKGNNDYFISKEHRIIKIENLMIFMVHGHKMYLSKENMVVKAKEKQCNIFLFGHTHRPFYEFVDGVHLLNPGALSYSRSQVGETYAIININNDNKIEVNFEIV